MNRLLMLFALLAVIRKRLWSGIRQAGAFLALPRLVLCLFLVSGFSDQAHAHSNGRVYPIVEITDAQLSRIEFDGLIHDWEELGEPTMTFTRDFRTFKHWQTPDLADLDFRIWLRWHDKTNRIYLAYVGTDDVYHNNFEYGPYQTMDSYDSVSLLIDADHSGGKGVDFNSGDQEKWEEVAGRTQKYDAVALAAGGPKLDESTIRWIRDWDLSFHVFPPYGDAAGSVIGETPTIITIEMYISPHNHWLKGVDSSPDQTEFSELAAGKIIGFAVMVTDMDGFDLAQSGMWIPLEMPSDDPDPEGLISFVWADAILDGLLVPAGQADTSVREDSWARIKATFISESGTSMLPTRRPVGYPAKSLRPAY